MLEGLFAKVADAMFDVGIVQFGAFRLKLHETKPDAPLSPIFLNIRTSDNKNGKLTPELLGDIAELLASLVHARFDFFAGIPKAGEPLADAFGTHIAGSSSPAAKQLHLGKEETEEGRRISGVVEDLDAEDTGWSILLIDDLVTHADTKFEAIYEVEHDGLSVACLVVLVDREQGGRQQIEEAGYRVVSAFTLSELLEHYVVTGRIGQEKADEVQKYLADNQAQNTKP